MVLAAGAALDYARVANMREGIQGAVSAASEAGVGAVRDATLGDVQIETIALSHFDKDVAFARHVGTIDPPIVKVDRQAHTVTVGAKGTVAMTVSRLFGVNEIEVPATATSSWAPQSADAQDNSVNVGRQIMRRF
ncbi:MAG: hypothetical protein JSR78_01655 [Proteobacteria bacterium]|nr:hypothetical protein [Pseudomonadota bacterium]